MSDFSTLSVAWGKYDDETGAYHRLEHHCADVAACFEELVRDPVLHNRFSCAAGEGNFCTVNQSRLTVIAFLHDFSKLNTGFQFKVGLRRELLKTTRPDMRQGHINEAFFFCRSRRMCEALGFHELFEHWGEGFIELLIAALSHHGRPAHEPNSGDGPPELWQPLGEYDPHKTAQMMLDRMKNWFPEAFNSAEKLSTCPELAHLFAGTVALADQIGSDRELFPYEPDPDPAYIKRARRRAKKAIEIRGLARGDRPGGAKAGSFQDLFGYPTPRPLQQVVANAPLDSQLLILESETGSGKTEAALMRFAALWRAGLVDSLYFALPTRAAAKQIHHRVDKALRQLFADDKDWVKTVLAIPGYYKVGEEEGHWVGDFKVYWEDEPDEEQRQARWAAESTRHYLSSTAAVGTIDQALLGALKVKWAHLRGAALSRSLLVVDEVHASDSYMTELLSALLKGHLELGGHALLMSATLGSTAREAFVRGTRRNSLPTDSAKNTPYPLLTIARNGKPELHPIENTGQKKRVRMRTVPILTSASGVAKLAIEQAEQGARVLVIRNTVIRAQETFEELINMGGEGFALTVNDISALHHSRFAVEDRLLLDEAVECALGKQRQKSGGRVIIGTQTLEQSLDIDADFLTTDLCPIDVLLQRTGRLHRHREIRRPETFTAPCCIVLTPEDGLETGLKGQLLRYGLGISGDNTGVYRNLLVIEQTLQLIINNEYWTIPDMNRELVESATHSDLLAQRAQQLGDVWHNHWQKNWGSEAAGRNHAKRLVLERNKRFSEAEFSDLDEEIRTRLGEDGPRVKLAEPIEGPFLKPVQTFNIPAHLFDPLPDKQEIEAATAVRNPTGITLTIGQNTFQYDRQGLLVK